MKLKVSLLGLILIVILFCMAKQSLAVARPPYFDGLGYPGEHPWQDVESPIVEAALTSRISSGIVIAVGPTKMIMIRASLIKSNSETTRQAPKKIELGYPTRKGND